MYREINIKLKVYKFLFFTLKTILFACFSIIFCLFIKEILFNFNKNSNNIYDNINVELVEKPIIQINDEKNNLTYITADSALIENLYKNITLNNVDINNDFIKGKSKIIIYNKDKDEIIMKEKPELIFYNKK